MSAKINSSKTSSVEKFAACFLFIIMAIPALITSYFSGATGGSGLFGVEPKFTDYIPGAGLWMGGLLLILGLTEIMRPAFMWLASAIVFIGFLVGILSA